MPSKTDHSRTRKFVLAAFALVLCLLSASRAYANVQICPKGGCPSRLTTIYTGANWENFTGPGGLIQDAQGNLYGTTYIGGGSSLGTVFELSPGPNGSWLEADIYTFLSCANTGCIPFPNLAMDSSGSLYGTTEYGGVNNSGTVFKLTLKSGVWTESTIHSFTPAVTAAPNSLSYWNGLALNRTTGVLYGPGNNGQIWELVPGNAGWTFNVIATLSDPAIGGLVIDSSGALYGTAAGNDRGIILRCIQPILDGSLTSSMPSQEALTENIRRATSCCRTRRIGSSTETCCTAQPAVAALAAWERCLPTSFQPPSSNREPLASFIPSLAVTVPT
jgi:uncharacterized repeat protein (TIGR03803 family)